MTAVWEEARKGQMNKSDTADETELIDLVLLLVRVGWIWTQSHSLLYPCQFGGSQKELRCFEVHPNAEMQDMQ